MTAKIFAGFSVGITFSPSMELKNGNVKLLRLYWSRRCCSDQQRLGRALGLRPAPCSAKAIGNLLILLPAISFFVDSSYMGLTLLMHMHRAWFPSPFACLPPWHFFFLMPCMSTRNVLRFTPFAPAAHAVAFLFHRMLIGAKTSERWKNTKERATMNLPYQGYYHQWKSICS